MLSVTKKWQGDYKAYGSAYTFALLHTVVNDHYDDDEVGEGCEEFLVFFR